MHHETSARAHMQIRGQVRRPLCSAPCFPLQFQSPDPLPCSPEEKQSTLSGEPAAWRIRERTEGPEPVAKLAENSAMTVLWVKPQKSGMPMTWGQKTWQLHELRHLTPPFFF